MVDTTTGVSVTVTDVEEDGVVTLSSDEPETGEDLDATLEDGDGSLSEESWQWARSANGRTNWINIAGETLSSYTPTEDDEDFYLRARVEYTDNRGSGKSAEGSPPGLCPARTGAPASLTPRRVNAPCRRTRERARTSGRPSPRWTRRTTG